jgi:anti-sigma-K factor RskA
MLELYCAGSLTDAERREVEQMALQYPDVQAELDAIHSTLDALAQKHSITPPAFVKEKIMRAIEEKPLKVVNRDAPDVNAISVWGLTEAMAKLAVAASILIAVLGVSLAYYFDTRLEQTRRELAQVRDSYNQSKQQTAVLSSYNDRLKEDISMVNNMHTVKVILNGVPAHPGMEVAVYWNPKDKTVMLDPGNLPVPPQGMQYQLWSIGAAGPVDAGVFKTDSTLQEMKSTGEAVAFAITLEKAGGSLTPTMNQMYVMGKPEGVSL